MGTFGGHALPGSFFIIFAVWHVVRLFQKYYNSRQRNTRFTSQVMMDCPCLCGRLKDLPVEAFVKIFFISIGLGLEIYTGMRNGKFVAIGNGQHATMFFFFGLTGVIEILIFYKAPIPAGMDYLSYAVAFLVEGVLFRFHLHGRTDLDVLVHTLLLYVIFLGAVCVFVEMYFRHSLLAALARCFLLLLQGTWFWQIAFILYNPNKDALPWRPDNHDDLMLATMYFTWHSGMNFVFILLIGASIACCYGRGRDGYKEVDDDITLKRLIQTGSNGQTVVSLNDDSDSDVEFQKALSN